ncbi:MULTISPECIES: nitrate reductase subunit alpha [unclassified Moraxella]|uniref:nitrate reductase subunit alpha n=1 Tax=unclassified Moraxella TaxID=2685852 RepID=UPI003AF904C2
MSHLLDQFKFFTKKQSEFADGHGEVRDESRDWENSYRSRWQYDKIVRSTHGVNCTGSCSWKIYVKNGLVTWETQQTDYPRTRPDLPNHEPRGCPRGASYSWYMYSANRLKYPKVRKPLLKLWREAKAQFADPVEAWGSIVSDPAKTAQYKSKRGLGGFVRSSWNEVNEIIAAANVYTAKTFGPDRIIGFSPIPAMSMVSYAAGSRYLSLIGGVCLSFYDWYCDLPPASPMIWGEQTDVPESADWYNSDYIIAWGSNVPQTRTPDAHFFTEVRYKGTKTVAITPDYAEISKLCDLWLNPKQGTDAALAQAFCHVIIKEFYLKQPSDYFVDYAKRYTDLPMLVMVEGEGRELRAGRFLRASDLTGNLEQDNNPEWKTVAINQNGELVSPQGSIGYRWGDAERADKGKWNLEARDGSTGAEIDLALSQKDSGETVEVGLDYFGGDEHPYFTAVAGDAIQYKTIPCRTINLANGQTAKVMTVFDLMVANLGVANGVGGQHVTDDYNDATVAGTPAWQEAITGVSREKVIQIAREFAENAHKTHGKSMIIIGAGMNHWYHLDMNYRGVINMLMLCGCIGKSGGGWAHYVGQEKLRPQTGWAPLAFALDWHRPPRHMNGTSFFYNHSSQWRYEKLSAHELLSPHANKTHFPEHMLDYNIRAERAGWLPSAPQLNRNPLTIANEAKAKGMNVEDYVVESLQNGSLSFACESPDNPANFPRNLFIWRSNLLGSSGKGHEYMLKYLLGTKNGVLGDETVAELRPHEVDWVENAPTGKLDLVTTLDFRMSSTCLYSDIVLPTATWYEKDDMNTSDMHPFIHPLTAATDPAWESKSDWEIYKGIANVFSQLSATHLGVQTDVVTLPMQHDSVGELAQPFGGTDWKTAGEKPVPGKNCPHIKIVERDYPSTYAKYTALGTLMDTLGNGSKGINWDTKEEVGNLADLNYRVTEPTVAQGRPRISTAIDAAETILMLAPETNGHVAVKAWADLSKTTGRDHTHLAKSSEHEKIRFRDIVAQPRKIISSPTWSGLESEKVSYNAGYTNVHELIPWRTITGRQQFYQDHPWMQAFGEQMQQYRPPIDTKTVEHFKGYKTNGNKEVVLNFLTPHQKWGIHSTYSENLLMLTLSRGGPCVWMSEIDARKADIQDNDWIEVFNANGSITARAVVSQRVKEGMTMMYHAQEKLVNIPGSESTGTRGGIHNSVTRAVLKPTHMIGGYAQQAYGFNYYGTVGCNRDEFVLVRKMAKVDWLEGKPDDELPRPLPTILD